VKSLPEQTRHYRDTVNVLYLHGFRSSPQSTKATMLRQSFAEAGACFVCPQLPASPQAAVALAESLIAERGDPARDWALIGSSLGGYYATWLAERCGARTVLLNPAIRPADDLRPYLGAVTAWHSGETFLWRDAYLDELRALAPGVLAKPERYLLIAAKGDEVIDWRDMVTHYAGAHQIVLEGSDHALSDFAALIPAVIDFCLDGRFDGSFKPADARA